MSVSTEFMERLSRGATTTCLCWRLTRTDGFIVAGTEHDKDLEVDGVLYRKDLAMVGARFETGLGLAPGHAAAEGALASDAITDADLAAGLWNGTAISVIRADWATPEHWLHVWSGWLSDVAHGPNGFHAELVSQKAQLERVIGRQYVSHCDAVLGDARCGVDLADPEFQSAQCDRAFSTCKTVFRNAENFRGFPHMPGTDFVLSGPGANSGDGGAR